MSNIILEPMNVWLELLSKDPILAIGILFCYILFWVVFVIVIPDPIKKED